MDIPSAGHETDIQTVEIPEDAASDHVTAISPILLGSIEDGPPVPLRRLQSAPPDIPQFFNNLAPAEPAQSPPDAARGIQDVVRLGRQFAQGTFKRVHHGSWNSAPVAVLVNDGAISGSALREEAALLESLERPHPNLVCYYGCCHARNAEYLIMEVADHGSLDDLLRKARGDGYQFHTAAKVAMALQVAAGAGELAANGVLHRDLAARNVLVHRLSPIHVKVADFGLARRMSDFEGGGTGSSTSAAREPLLMVPYRWLPPECMAPQPRWSEASDVWAYGVLLWEIFADAAEPYSSHVVDVDVMYHVKRGGRLPKPPLLCSDLLGNPQTAPFGKMIADRLYQVMLNCWNADPDKRPAFEDLKARLADIFEDLTATSGAAGVGAQPAIYNSPFFATPQTRSVRSPQSQVPSAPTASRAPSFTSGRDRGDSSARQAASGATASAQNTSSSRGPRSASMGPAPRAPHYTLDIPESFHFSSSSWSTGSGTRGYQRWGSDRSRQRVPTATPPDPDIPTTPTETPHQRSISFSAPQTIDDVFNADPCALDTGGSSAVLPFMPAAITMTEDSDLPENRSTEIPGAADQLFSTYVSSIGAVKQSSNSASLNSTLHNSTCRSQVQASGTGSTGATGVTGASGPASNRAYAPSSRFTSSSPHTASPRISSETTDPSPGRRGGPAGAASGSGAEPSAPQGRSAIGTAGGPLRIAPGSVLGARPPAIGANIDANLLVDDPASGRSRPNPAEEIAASAPITKIMKSSSLGQQSIGAGSMTRSSFRTVTIDSHLSGRDPPPPPTSQRDDVQRPNSRLLDSTQRHIEENEVSVFAAPGAPSLSSHGRGGTILDTLDTPELRSALPSAAAESSVADAASTAARGPPAGAESISAAYNRFAHAHIDRLAGASQLRRAASLGTMPSGTPREAVRESAMHSTILDLPRGMSNSPIPLGGSSSLDRTSFIFAVTTVAHAMNTGEAERDPESMNHLSQWLTDQLTAPRAPLITDQLMDTMGRWSRASLASPQSERRRPSHGRPSPSVGRGPRQTGLGLPGILFDNIEDVTWRAAVGQRRPSIAGASDHLFTSSMKGGASGGSKDLFTTGGSSQRFGNGGGGVPYLAAAAETERSSGESLEMRSQRATDSRRGTRDSAGGGGGAAAAGASGGRSAVFALAAGPLSDLEEVSGDEEGFSEITAALQAQGESSSSESSTRLAGNPEVVASHWLHRAPSLKPSAFFSSSDKGSGGAASAGNDSVSFADEAILGRLERREDSAQLLRHSPRSARSATFEFHDEVQRGVVVQASHAVQSAFSSASAQPGAQAPAAAHLASRDSDAHGGTSQATSYVSPGTTPSGSSSGSAEVMDASPRPRPQPAATTAQAADAQAARPQIFLPPVIPAGVSSDAVMSVISNLSVLLARADTRERCLAQLADLGLGMRGAQPPALHPAPPPPPRPARGANYTYLSSLVAGDTRHALQPIREAASSSTLPEHSAGGLSSSPSMTPRSSTIADFVTASTVFTGVSSPPAADEFRRDNPTVIRMVKYPSRAGKDLRGSIGGAYHVQQQDSSGMGVEDPAEVGMADETLDRVFSGAAVAPTWPPVRPPSDPAARTSRAKPTHGTAIGAPVARHYRRSGASSSAAWSASAHAMKQAPIYKTAARASSTQKPAPQPSLVSQRDPGTSSSAAGPSRNPPRSKEHDAAAAATARDPSGSARAITVTPAARQLSGSAPGMTPAARQDEVLVRSSTSTGQPWPLDEAPEPLENADKSASEASVARQASSHMSSASKRGGGSGGCGTGHMRRRSGKSESQTAVSTGADDPHSPNVEGRRDCSGAASILFRRLKLPFKRRQ